MNKRPPKSPKQALARRGPLDELLDADLFKALGDPTRLRLLACLAKCGRACTVSEIAECCSVDLSVVSRHLALLERAKVVESKKEGRTVSYLVRYGELTALWHALGLAFERCCVASPASKSDSCC